MDEAQRLLLRDARATDARRDAKRFVKQASKQRCSTPADMHARCSETWRQQRSSSPARCMNT
jgi:hypothetical protein